MTECNLNNLILIYQAIQKKEVKIAFSPALQNELCPYLCLSLCRISKILHMR